MKLLLVNQYFWPDRAATAQLLADLAEDAVAAGHSVTALAARGRYSLDADRHLASRESWQGVQIRRVWSTDFGRSTTIRRLLDYLTFLCAALPRVLFGPRQDVAVCLSTPPLVAVLGLLAKLRGTRFVYKVEDLYPDVAVALGALHERSAATRVFERLSRLLLRHADLCVALDEAMGRRLEAKGARRVEIVPNWADGDAISPDPQAGQRFRETERLDGQLTVLYSGNLGMAHRFDAIVAAARQLAEREAPVRFLFVGGGQRLGEVRDATSDLPNVRFLPYQPRSRLNDLYNAADIHLVCLRDEVAGLLVPSKYAAALSAGKPVLLVGGESSDLFTEVEDEGVGWACRHRPDEVLRAIDECLADPQALSARGLRARRVFTRRYDRSAATARWLELLTGG